MIKLSSRNYKSNDGKQLVIDRPDIPATILTRPVKSAERPLSQPSLTLRPPSYCRRSEVHSYTPVSQNPLYQQQQRGNSPIGIRLTVWDTLVCTPLCTLTCITAERRELSLRDSLRGCDGEGSEGEEGENDGLHLRWRECVV